MPILILFVVWSCKPKPDPFQPEDQSDFFPLAIGQERIYELDSIVFDLNAPQRVDTAHFFWKEVVSDTFRDAAEGLWYSVQRYRRDADTLPWAFVESLAAAQDAGRALWQEDNLRFIKLVFPFDEFTFWDGNAYIPQGVNIVVGGETLQAFDNWNYRIESLAEADTIQNRIYGQVVKVREAEDENLISLRQAESYYARGIGLVWRSWSILDTQQLDGEVPWEEKAEKGFILRQWLIETNF